MQYLLVLGRTGGVLGLRVLLVQEQVDYKTKEKPLTVCYRRSEVFSLDLISLQPRAKLIGILA